MSLKRLLLLCVLALTTTVVVVSSAAAGDVADEPCPDIAGPDTATCPVGTTGTPYSLTFLLKEGAGCGPVSPPIWSVTSGTFPPGLTLSSEGVVSGTPTQAGNFTFYLRVHHPFVEGSCAGDFSDKQMTIPINPGAPPVPKLTIGPESVATATVGTPYSAAMIANLPDPKTWEIVEGSLPVGLTIGANDGLISGTPIAAGSFPFTVRAMIDANRTDTKSLTIDVRERLAISAATPFDATRSARTEVGVPFLASLSATGGFGTYTWTADALPPGFELDADGTLVGDPLVAGTYRFTVAVTDQESRRAVYTARIVVAERLAVATKRVKAGKVGRLYRVKIVARGGVLPLKFKVKRGPLPRGIFFDPSTGTFFGTPKKAGTWNVTVEITDALRVKAKATLKIVVAPAPRR